MLKTESNPIAVWITDTHLSENTVEINLSIFGQVFDFCDTNDHRIVMLGGDVFTSRKGQSEIVLNTFKKILDDAHKRNIRLIAIAGNHDKTDYTSPSSFLDPFDGHPALSVINPYGSLHLENGVDVHLLPYYDERLTYVSYLEKIQTNPTKTNILLTHVAIDGVTDNSGSKVANEIPQSLFDRFDVVFVGHYHNRQIIGSRNHIVYTGSGYPANFGEDSEKGAVLLYDTGEYEFIPLHFPQYATGELLIDDLDQEFINTIKQQVSDDLNIRLKIGGEVNDDNKRFIDQLLEMGVKVNLIKEDYRPMDVIHSESVEITSSDIKTWYHEWVKDRKIDNPEYGEQLLNQVL